MRKTTVADFWNKAIILGKEDCWEWQRALSSDGYGKCGFMEEQLAHRISYKIATGSIPKGKCVLHKCDNRKCINPDHLFIGTRTDNNKDRDNKKRTARGNTHGSRTKPESRPRGENHSRAIFSDKQVQEIRNLYATGEHTHRSLAKRFGTSHSVIGQITRHEIRKEQK